MKQSNSNKVEQIAICLEYQRIQQMRLELVTEYTRANHGREYDLALHKAILALDNVAKFL